MGPNAGVDYNLTLCPLQSRLQHIYHGQPARVDLNLCQRWRLYPPVGDFGSGLRDLKIPKYTEQIEGRILKALFWNFCVTGKFGKDSLTGNQ